MKGTAARGRWSDEDESHATGPVNVAQGAGREHHGGGHPSERPRPHCSAGRRRRAGALRTRAASDRLADVVDGSGHDTAEVGLLEIFGALFPCASVTGAPKVSTMSVIADLEASPRGVYCGAVGLVRPAPPGVATPPSARFAVAIRTAVVDRSQQSATYGSGGGITWDSTGSREWEEVLLKARRARRGRREHRASRA